jgi:hypothetical protein
LQAGDAARQRLRGSGVPQGEHHDDVRRRRREVHQHVDGGLAGEVGVVEHHHRRAAAAARPQQLVQRAHHLVARDRTVQRPRRSGHARQVGQHGVGVWADGAEEGA